MISFGMMTETLYRTDRIADSLLNVVLKFRSSRQRMQLYISPVWGNFSAMLCYCVSLTQTQAYSRYKIKKEYDYRNGFVGEWTELFNGTCFPNRKKHDLNTFRTINASRLRKYCIHFWDLVNTQCKYYIRPNMGWILTVLYFFPYCEQDMHKQKGKED